MMLNNIKSYLDKKSIKFLSLNFVIIIVGYIYLLIKQSYLNEMIPFWYTKPWGTMQLAYSNRIILIPLLAIVIVTLGFALATYASRKYIRFGRGIIFGIATSANLLLNASLIRIIKIGSTKSPSLVTPEYAEALLPMLITFLFVWITTPRIIEFLKKQGIVTDPEIHKHPGMLLKKPSARAGGAVFTLGILVISLFFVEFTPSIKALYFAVTLTALLGLLDDIQNTKMRAKLKMLENPLLRFGLQALAVTPILLSQIRINSIRNPFDGMLHLNNFLVDIGSVTLAPFAILVTLLWLLWVMNVLSWSNGVDGQYAGIVGISAAAVMIITLRLVANDPAQQNMVYIAAITAGAAFGLVPYTWNPSKIMWGFGAISAGTMLAALAILTEAKIATAFIVLIIPFLDGVITISRRIAQRKSPFKGDGGHLHHLLLQRGWSVKKVAAFYWITTAFAGLIGIVAADKSPILAIITLGGVVAFFIIALNIRSIFVKKLP